MKLKVSIFEEFELLDNEQEILWVVSSLVYGAAISNYDMYSIVK